MGIRQSRCICEDCEKNKRRIDEYYDYGEFWIALEWMSKSGLLEYIKERRCPICGSDNWSLTDASQI